MDWGLVKAVGVVILAVIFLILFLAGIISELNKFDEKMKPKYEKWKKEREEKKELERLERAVRKKELEDRLRE